ncbi:MAG TPA: type IV pilus twitching motility protein PilT [Candidatus Eisenbacteria bacterium]|nr:type IV pilus twitching motility protein PilT [Candidatus Eisenbacteria bacterium]
MPWLDPLFKLVVEKGASDLHLSSGMPPLVRLHGSITALEGQAAIPADAMKTHLKEIAPEANWKEFESLKDTDFAYALAGSGRFRCNYFEDNQGPGAVFRAIPDKIPAVDDLRLPRAIVELCQLKKGLILVTGPTGSGKSTTLAAMIDHINTQRREHIITIEDPIEFVYPKRSCVVTQREVRRHTASFKAALRAALREDPDIVLVGEMRDLETVEIALETAETGHLVFATLHTNTAASAIDRIIDQFPSNQQNQIRTMLASSLKGVIAQSLCRKKSGAGRIAAYEVLIVNSAVAANIRDAKTHQIVSAMQIGQAIGMRLLNDSLLQHVKEGLIDPMEAYTNAVDKKDLFTRLKETGHPIDASQLAGV